MSDMDEVEEPATLAGAAHALEKLAALADAVRALQAASEVAQFMRDEEITEQYQATRQGALIAYKAGTHRTAPYNIAMEQMDKREKFWRKHPKPAATLAEARIHLDRLAGDIAKRRK